MTKTLKYFLIILTALACIFVFAFAGCSSDDDEKDDTVPDEKVDENDGDNDDEGSGDITPVPDVPAVEYTVTFDLNYDGSVPVTVTVTEGDTVSAPESPTREGGYLFSGWYADSACETDFDFSQAITSDMTVYAGWLERTEGMVYITYMYNFEGAGTYKVEEITSNTRVTSSNLDRNCSRDGYKFIDWYTDSDCTSIYEAGRVTEDISLYALWYKSYIFEAEYTDLTDDEGDLRHFQGYSQNATPIFEDSSASNGYYIGDMYIKEAYICFDIYSEIAVEDARLDIRVAMDFGWDEEHGGFTNGNVTISSDDYTLTVNGTKVSYSTMSFQGAGNLAADAHTSFVTREIGSVPLEAGWNTIMFEVTNEIGGQGGTQNALAPIFDYLMLSVPEETTLSWNPLESNLTTVW